MKYCNMNNINDNCNGMESPNTCSNNNVSTGRETIALNPNAIEFEPPTYASTVPKDSSEDPFMSQDGEEQSCGDNSPTEKSMKLSADGSANNPNVTAGAPEESAEAEGQMAEAASMSQEPAIESTSDDRREHPETQPAVVEQQELSKEKITELVLAQAPFFFTRENWSSDHYLLSQMDSDQYVPIHVVASCSQFKAITKNHYSIMDALKESELVQIDLEKHRVRPNYKRCIVILREIPESTPTNEIEELFAHEDCPNVVSCEFINNDSWYVTFNNDDDAQKAYRHLREVVKTFKDKVIAARIKTKPLTRQNCFAVLPRQPKAQPQTTTQQQQQQTLSSNGPSSVVTTSVTQPTPPAQYQASQRYIYPAVNAPFNYYPNVSAQVPANTTQAYFYPSPLMQYPGNFYDINSFINYNGLSPKATFKPLSTSRFPVPNAGNSSHARGGSRRWGNESRSQSLNSTAQSGVRSSTGPRTTTVHTNTVASTNSQVNLGGQLRTEGSFGGHNAFTQNGSTNAPIFSTFSPPVSDVDTERTEGSPLVSGAEYTPAPAFMSQPASFEAGGAAVQTMPGQYTAPLTGYGQAMYRNGYAPEQRTQNLRGNNNNNGGGRRRLRRDDDGQNGSAGRPFQRGYNGEGRPAFQDRRRPQFNLQATSFPPLPGSDEPTAVDHVVPEEPVEAQPATAWNVETQKFSDIMKGKPKQEKTEGSAVAGAPSAPSGNQCENVSAPIQAASKPKPTPVAEDCPLDVTQATKNIQPAPKEQRVPRSTDEKRTARRDAPAYNPKPIKKENSAKFGKENRPSPSIRPNREQQDGWLSKGKSTRSNCGQADKDTEELNPKNPNAKLVKPLTNGDISPLPSVPRPGRKDEHNKAEKTASEKSYVDANKEVNAVVANATTGAQGENPMSWAKLAKQGKDEMEKLSAVIKEKEEQERIKKNRSGGRNPPVKPSQESGKPIFRREGKDKSTSVTEAKPVDKPASNSRPPKDFRPKSPKPQQ